MIENSAIFDQENSPDHTALMVRADKLELLYRQSFPALFISVIVSSLMCLMLWQNTDAAILLGWFAAVSAGSLIRLIVFLSYFRAKPQGRDLLKWEKPYIGSLIFSSLVWGIGSLLIMPKDSHLHQAVVAFFLIGMAGGAISTFSAHRIMAIFTMMSVLLPTTLWFLLQGDPLQIGLAIGSMIFMIAALRATKVLGHALQRSFQLTHELKTATDRAEKLARTDSLTGINNRRAFFEYAQQIIKYCARHHLPLSAIVMDVDHFKNINDVHGHAVGDAALQQLANTLVNTFRKSDIYGRTGGEEFAILLPDTTMEAACQIAEKLRQSIAGSPVDFQGKEIPMTASMGVASGEYDVDTLLQHADTALYRAKDEGRNRVICHENAERVEAKIPPGFILQ
jgi:diguanylate cyclase (GGDEF)-like protein